MSFSFQNKAKRAVLTNHLQMVTPPFDISFVPYFLILQWHYLFKVDQDGVMGWCNFIFLVQCLFFQNGTNKMYKIYFFEMLRDVTFFLQHVCFFWKYNFFQMESRCNVNYFFSNVQFLLDMLLFSFEMLTFWPEYSLFTGFFLVFSFKSFANSWSRPTFT